SVYFLHSLPHSPSTFAFFFYMLPRSPRYTLFPYTTLSDLQLIFIDLWVHQMKTPISVIELMARDLDEPYSSSIRDKNEKLQNGRSEEHTSELQSRFELVCRLLLEKKNRTEIWGGGGEESDK